MKASILCRALQASVLALLFTETLAQAAATTTTQALGSIQTMGCYNKPDPLIQDNTNTFQTSGICQKVCGAKNHAVMAITGGSTCYCGDELPSTDKEVDKSNCNSPCQGYDQQTCGGIGFFQVYLTGLTGDVSIAPNSTTSTTAQSTAAAPSSTRPAATVIVTQSASPVPTQSSSSGPSKVGIAVGAVVGVIAIAATAAGAIFFMRQKRRKEIEKEHKAQAAINPFVSSRGSDAKSDARLDPSVASSYRRESIGSIADERDFSRRILQVRNPDHRGSLNSVA